MWPVERMGISYWTYQKPNSCPMAGTKLKERQTAPIAASVRGNIS